MLQLVVTFFVLFDLLKLSSGAIQIYSYSKPGGPTRYLIIIWFMEINPSRALGPSLGVSLRTCMSGSAILAVFHSVDFWTRTFSDSGANSRATGGGWKTGRQMLFSGITSVWSPGLGFVPVDGSFLVFPGWVLSVLPVFFFFVAIRVLWLWLLRNVGSVAGFRFFQREFTFCFLQQ